MILRKQLSFLCLISCYNIWVSGDADQPFLTLEMTQILFRHGARTPLGCEANLIPERNDSWYDPWGIAQLTSEGMEQEYHFGTLLGVRYAAFLPAQYKLQDVYAYASGTARAQTSLQLVLAGLYPPVGQLVWSDKLNWLPISIVSNPQPLDILMKPRLCLTFAKALDLVLESGEMVREFEQHKPILQKMREIYWKSFDLPDIFCAYNAIKVHKEMNLPIPSWYTDEIYSDLYSAKEFYLDALSYTDDLKRLNGGPLVRRFVENMNDTHRRDHKRKIYLYSGHDTTLHAFLKVHNVSDLTQPDYGDAIMVEKYRDEHKKVYVRIFHWAGHPKEMRLIKLNDCPAFCPFRDYVEIVKPYLPSDDEMLCLYRNISPEDMEMIIDPDSVTDEGKRNYII